ncbi:ATP-binding protein [Chondromyces apiculatus]|nr:ATP-binding protein [Chondromyces apiculatus]
MTIPEPYSIKRGTISLMSCDAEPVHTPGCIQSHGVLLVLRRGDLTILQVSENSADHLGKAPDALLGRSIAEVLGGEHDTALARFVEQEPVEKNPLHVFSIEFSIDATDAVDAQAAAPPDPRGPLDALVHTIDGVIVLELERTGRAQNRPDYYALVRKTVTRLQTAQSLRDLCQIAAEDLWKLTGIDRVMIYRFHPDHSGEVFAEAKRADLAPFFGLHYPADDIPGPAREIFRKTWVRPLADARGAPSELVPLANPDSGKPLEMTYCALRGASVMYTEYLENIGVAASLTLSIRRGDQLWGLVACHHEQPFQADFQVRAACELLAQVVSLQLVAAEQREQLEYRLALADVQRKLVERAATEGSIAPLLQGTPSLADAVGSDGTALFHERTWSTVGRTPAQADLDALVAWLRTRGELDRPPHLYVTDHLGEAHPPAQALRDTASGLLAASLAHGGRSFILWFRAETLRMVNWAGDPGDKPVRHGPHGPRLTPRRSFELWQESVRGHAVPWSPADIEAAGLLRVALMELVVSHAERLAALNQELQRSNEELDAFAYVASHDLKEPLRGIHKYATHLAERAAEGTDEESKERLSSVLRLTVRMDSLINALLLFSRVGRTGLRLERVDGNELVAEALDLLGGRREETRIEIRIPRPLPTLLCDRVRVREVLVNLISNAMKYNQREARWVEIGWREPTSATPLALYVRDNGIGIKPRYFDQIFKIFKRLHGRDEFTGGTGAGLAIVKKVVDLHGGRIWIDSVMGEGSTFFFTLAPESTA